MYRLLEENETIKKGDEWWNQSVLDEEVGQWNKHIKLVGTIVTKKSKPIRRKITNNTSKIEHIAPVVEQPDDLIDATMQALREIEEWK